MTAATNTIKASPRFMRRSFAGVRGAACAAAVRAERLATTSARKAIRAAPPSSGRVSRRSRGRGPLNGSSPGVSSRAAGESRDVSEPRALHVAAALSRSRPIEAALHAGVEAAVRARGRDREGVRARVRERHDGLVHPRPRRCQGEVDRRPRRRPPCRAHVEPGEERAGVVARVDGQAQRPVAFHCLRVQERVVDAARHPPHGLREQRRPLRPRAQAGGPRRAQIPRVDGDLAEAATPRRENRIAERLSGAPPRRPSWERRRHSRRARAAP
jgi:hypothetical protein